MRASEAGFTLVEVLVAMVVSALLLTIISQGSSVALRRLRLAAERREALLDGRYLLTRRAVDVYSAQGTAGRTGRLAWRIEETPVAADPRGFLVLARIHVAVRTLDGALLFDQSVLRLKALKS